MSHMDNSKNVSCGLVLVLLGVFTVMQGSYIVDISA